jgi:putative copper resistance protein D
VLAPLLLALGAPFTLALRAIPRSRDPDLPGAREWLLAILRGRPARLASHPLTVAVGVAAGLYLTYSSAAFTLIVRSHPAHLAALAGFLTVGYLFFWTTVGVDPSPGRRTRAARRWLLTAGVLGYAVFGFALVEGRTVIAADWFAALDRRWGLPPLADQATAGVITWLAGALPVLGALAATFVGRRRQPGGLPGAAAAIPGQ